MSRVYEALRQSQVEAGEVADLFDADSLVADPALAMPAVVKPALKEVRSDFAWDEIRSMQPNPTAESRLVVFTEDSSLGAEKFRLLRARIRNLREKQPLRKIVITSAVPAEGKTLVSMNLAISLAKHSSEKVLLLEGDLRKPTLTKHLRVPDTGGLDDWFGTSDPITKFMHRFDGLQLWLLPGGHPRDNPLTLLQSPRFSELYRELSTLFDWILIDAPPMLPMADVNFWSRQADGLLLVCREGRTPKTVLKKGLEVLDNPQILGIVINEGHTVESSYYHHYYSRHSNRHL